LTNTEDIAAFMAVIGNAERAEFKKTFSGLYQP